MDYLYAIEGIAFILSSLRRLLQFVVDMDTYIDRFHSMVKELDHHPDILVTHYHRGSPASDQDIQAAERICGKELPESMKKFYKAANGLSLSWIKKDRARDGIDEQVVVPHISDTENQEVLPDYHDPLDINHFKRDYEPFDGVVNIPDLVSLFEWDWSDDLYRMDSMADDTEITLHNSSFENELKLYQSIRPVDAFSKECGVALYLTDQPDIPLMLGQNHYADFKYTALTDFESYLELVLAQKAVVDRRSYFYSQFGGFQAANKPKKPRKPLSAFFHYSTAMRSSTKAQNPDASYSDLSRILGSDFGSLPEAEKQNYTTQAIQDMERYTRENAEYTEALLTYEAMYDPRGWLTTPRSFWTPNRILDLDKWVESQHTT